MVWRICNLGRSVSTIQEDRNEGSTKSPEDSKGHPAKEHELTQEALFRQVAYLGTSAMMRKFVEMVYVLPITRASVAPISAGDWTT
jgi:hypothetical protein